MSKKLISTLLALVLIGVVLSPSLLVMVDNKVEIGLFENSEEEKENRGEHKLEIESLLSTQMLEMALYKKEPSKKYTGNFRNTYPVLYLNLLSPPPELI